MPVCLLWRTARRGSVRSRSRRYTVWGRRQFQPGPSHAPAFMSCSLVIESWGCFDSFSTNLRPRALPVTTCQLFGASKIIPHF